MSFNGINEFILVNPVELIKMSLKNLFPFGMNCTIGINGATGVHFRDQDRVTGKIPWIL
jgi:hypothetical protein